MKTLWKAFVVLLLMHALALGGVVVWLKSSGRLDRHRIAQVRDIFSKPIAQEQAELVAAQIEEQENQRKSREAARLASIADNGAVTIAQRLESGREADEIAMQRVDRLHRDIASLQQQLVLAKDLLAKQKSQLEAERKAFDESRDRLMKLQDDADFQQAVQMFEQLPAKQAKEMFQQLIKDGKKNQVIDYLASMNLRKAAAVLKAFKTSEETIVATDLVQTLRERGIEPPVEINTPQSST